MSQGGVNVFAEGEESRAVLAERAGRMERRNQPRYLLVAAGGLVAIALVWLGLAWWRGQSASSTLLKERSLTYQIQQRVEEYQTEQKAQTDALGKDALRANPNLQSEIEQIGRDCGLGNMLINVGDDPRATRNLRRKRYAYTNFSPQETEMLLCWINRVNQGVDGVELAGVDIEPALATVDGKARWKGSISFTRWELKTN